MTKTIWAFIIVVVLYLAWLLYQNWAGVRDEHDAQVQNNNNKQPVAVAVNGDSLSGLPAGLETSFRTAKDKGTTTLREWLKIYGSQIQDPRKAWIELEFCVALARENPAEAKSIFASVKQRTPPSSPVWPRMKELEKTFE
ncbi:MAG: hypothetical protein HOP33_17190 [Verrucomicrobia bacterium]|nr:hypothetical protein [Verrucomicrobiota bacterium]